MIRNPKNCGTCRHDGCCEWDCCGLYWEPKRDNGTDHDDRDPWEYYDRREEVAERMSDIARRREP